MPSAPQVVMMNRPAGHRYGSWLTLHGSGAHLVGFSTSCWLSSHEGNFTMGLWASCRDTRCSSLAPEDVFGWLVAVRVLSCIGVALLLLWLLVGCQCKCVRSRQERHKWMTHLEELLAILSGFVALLSVGVFAMASKRDSSLMAFSFGWSFWLVVGGASACTVGGFIVAGTRNSAHLAPKPCSQATVRPITSPSVGPGSPATGGQQPGRARLEQPLARRQDDVSDIFNVVSYMRSHAGGPNLGPYRTQPHVVEMARPPPPPYSASDPESARDGTAGPNAPSVVEEATTNPVYELSLSPPPSYEATMNEQPPPYEPRPGNAAD